VLDTRATANRGPWQLLVEVDDALLHTPSGHIINLYLRNNSGGTPTIVHLAPGVSTVVYQNSTGNATEGVVHSVWDTWNINHGFVIEIPGVATRAGGYAGKMTWVLADLP